MGEVDEFFECSGDAVTDEETGITRAPGKPLKGKKTGWITTKGNAGTVYAEADTKKYFVEKEAELEDRFASAGAKPVRKLEVGETFTLLEGPREEKAPPEYRMKVRCLKDGKEGWVSKTPTTVRAANSMYRCLQDKVALTDSRAGTNVEDSKVLKEFFKGEQVEILEGPVEEGKELRIKCVTKDGKVGWVTIKGEDGKDAFTN